MSFVEYKNNDYYLTDNPNSSNNNLSMYSVFNPNNTPISYNTLENNNQNNQNNQNTSYESIGVTGNNINENQKFNKFTGETGFTGNSNYNQNKINSNVSNNMYNSNTMYNSNSMYNSNNVYGSTLGNNTQCPQNMNYLNTNGISSETVSQNLYCNSPSENSLKSLINAGLASVDSNGNINYNNLPSQSISSSISNQTIGLSSQSYNNYGYTGSSGSSMKYTGSSGLSMGYNGSSIGYTGSSIGYTGSSIGYTGSSMGYTGSSIGYTGSSMGYTGVQDSKNISSSIGSKLQQCNENNQICFYESYEGITTTKSLQEVVNKQTNVSQPVGKSQWIGADKSFNVGYNEISVAVVYSLSKQISKETFFTLFTSNMGYLFINDTMYIINKNIGNNLYMLANIPVQNNKDGSKTNINILLPGNSAILINNNELLNTNTEWTSKTYDLMNSSLSFNKLDPLDFAKNNITKNIISKKQNVYIIKDLSVQLNVTIDPLSSLISNSSTYKSYTDSEIKNSLNMKSVVYSPIEDLYVTGVTSSVSFAIYGSNIFDVYIKSNNDLIKLTNTSIYNKIVVNPSITLNSLSLNQKLAKGINHLYIVAPENTLIYIPYFKIDNVNDVFSNKQLSRSNDYTDVNKVNITTQYWKYIFVNIPYIQFNYLNFANTINNNFVTNESFVNYNNYQRIDLKENKTNNKNYKNYKNKSLKENKSNNIFNNIIPSSVKNLFSVFTSNGLEHYENNEEESYNELEAKIIKNDYIINSEKIREQIQNFIKNLNSDQQFNLQEIKKNYQDLISMYDNIIDSIKKKSSDATIKNNYNNVINDNNKQKLESTVNSEKDYKDKKLFSLYDYINDIYAKYNTNYNSVIDLYNKINNTSKTLIDSVTTSKNNDNSELDNIYNKLSTQLTILKSAIASDKYNDIKKEYDTYQTIAKSLKDRLPSISSTQSTFNSNIGTLDTLISDFNNSYKTFNDYKSNVVVPSLEQYKLVRDKIANINKYQTEAKTIIESPDFSCRTTQNYVASQNAINICTFIALVDNYNAQYYLLYSDPTTGIKAKIQKYIEINNTINTILKSNFNKQFPNLSNTSDISNFVNSLDYSIIWNSNDGINAINGFKSALTTYLTSYFKVLNKINSTFEFSSKVTIIDNSLITLIGGTDDKGGEIKKNSDKIKAYGTTELDKFNEIAKKAKSTYDILNSDVTKMLSTPSQMPLDDSKINGYLTTLKDYNKQILDNSKSYSTYETEIKKYVKNLSDCSDTFNVSESSSTSDIFYAKEITNKLAIMLNYKLVSPSTSIKTASMESFTNKEKFMTKEKFTNKEKFMTKEKFTNKEKFMTKEKFTNNITIIKKEDFDRLNLCEPVILGIPPSTLSLNEVTSGVWVDKYSAVSSLDVMEGYLHIVTIYQSNISANDIVTQIDTNNQPLTLVINGVTVNPYSTNKYKINIQNGTNMIQIRIDLSSTLNKKIKSRYLLFSAKVTGLGANKNQSIIINTNNSSEWRYMFEDNRYMKPVVKVGNNTSNCTKTCFDNNKSLCNNAYTLSGTTATVYDCNKITGINNINCNCLPISPKESFTNYQEDFTSTPKNSSNYGGSNNSGTTPKSYSGDMAFLTNKSPVNSVLLHKAPYKNDTYLTGMTMVDNNNNIYPVGTAYQDDVKSKLYSCKSGFSALKSNEKKLNNKNYIYNAALLCNEPIYEEDNIPFMKLIKEKSKNIVYGKVDNVNYLENTIVEDKNMKFEDCSKKCTDTKGCVGYVTEKSKNECKKVEKCEVQYNMKEKDCKNKQAKDIWDCDKSCKRGAFGKKYGCDEGCKCKFCTNVDECKDVPQTTGCTFKNKLEYNKKQNSSYFDTYYIKPSNNNPESTTVPTPIDNYNYFEYQS